MEGRSGEASAIGIRRKYVTMNEAKEKSSVISGVGIGCGAPDIAAAAGVANGAEAEVNIATTDGICRRIVKTDYFGDALKRRE